MQHQYGSPGKQQSKHYNIYPSVNDLKKPARRRIPHFAWEYLDSGTGAERLVDHNLQRLQRIEMVPQFMGGGFNVSLETRLMGKTYGLPFGIGPVGMTGLMWPGGEHMLARTAARQNIPYCLSTVACETPESVGPICEGNGWFQLYAPADRNICADMLNRAWDSGFGTLVITVDVPITATCERQRRAGLKMPPDKDLKTLLRVAARPHWALATLRHGMPRLKLLEKYAQSNDLKDVSSFLGRQLSEVLTLDYIKFIRGIWKGKIVVKGILHDKDARMLVGAGSTRLSYPTMAAGNLTGHRQQLTFCRILSKR
jgi:L-lactate dehydrogenase (cytochrome)